MVGLNADKTALTLTDGGTMEAASAFASAPQRITSWRARFTYQATNLSNGGGDGAAFVLQRDPRGITALGDNGNGLGYGGMTAITHSGAFRMDMYQDSGTDVATGGSVPLYGSTTPVNLLSGDPIRVTLTYDGAVLSERLHDLTTGDTYVNEDALNLPAAVGSNTAFVGFTGASGADTAVQTVRDFTFTVLPDVPPAQRKHIVVPIKTYKTLTDYVDPMIGTGGNPGRPGGCNTFPGPSAPFGMTQFSPDTSAPSIGYSYTDSRIQGFSMNHMSGVGCSDEGDVFLMPTTGLVQTQVSDYASPYSHRQEVAAPGYYRVRLLKSQILAELTATTRTGVARFTFPKGQPANILLPISHTLTQTYGASVQIVGDDELQGSVTSQSFCGANQRYTTYFVMRVNRPFASFGTWSGTTLRPGSRTAMQADGKSPAVGAYLTYPQGVTGPVTARIGISYVDIAGARANLDKEDGSRSFDAIHHAATAAWERELGVIHIKGGTTAQRVTFYTALYHALLMPSVFSDVDGRYIGFDDKIHTEASGHLAYANYSGWDIYRTEVPLLALIEPQRLQDMCQSIVDMYAQGGWIDRWPQLNTYTNVMCGSPLTTMMATAWEDGLHGFDMTTGYQGMYKDATQPAPPNKPYGGESNVIYMNQVGYIPDDKEGYGSVSQTEEDCIAYASLSHVAQSLGRTQDAQFLRQRALNYRNLFDPSTKFLRPKLLNGTWYSPFQGSQERGYVEGSAWQYRWLAPQDMAGLIALFGGTADFNTQLDQFFAYPHVEWDEVHYTPYNETDLEAPFLYDYSGAPWKTQARVRELQADAYNTTPNGIPGNDDCGTMSSWYVLSAMGLYAVDPASATYELTTPLFSKVTLHLAKPYMGHTLTISAPAASTTNTYIQSAHLGGQTWSRPWVPQSALVQGKTLTFTLGPQPNKGWGAAAGVRPPSLSK